MAVTKYMSEELTFARAHNPLRIGMPPVSVGEVKVLPPPGDTVGTGADLSYFMRLISAQRKTSKKRSTLGVLELQTGMSFGFAAPVLKKPRLAIRDGMP